MKYYLHLLLFLVLISYGSSLCLATDVILRTKADPTSSLTGQKVVLTVDVLAKDGWATINSFPLVEIPGAYLHRYETQGTRLNETVDGTSYSGQRYEVFLFAYKPGELKVESFPVEVAVKKWGGEASSKTEKLVTEPVQLTVKAPDGVKPGEYVPVTPRLEATQQYSSEDAEYSTGDAVEQTVTRKAEDISGMVFNPYEPPAIDGVRCYPGQPEVSDTFNRGVLTGSRVDTMTCVFEKPGTFTFPERTVTYWNVTKGQLDNITLPETSFTVKGGPEKQLVGTAAKGVSQGRGFWLYTISVAVLSCIFLFLFRTRIFAYIERWRKKNDFYEKQLFNDIEKTVKEGDKQKMLGAIMGWLDTLPGLSRPARLDEFVAITGGKEFSVLIGDLQTIEEWNTEECRRVYELLGRARKTYLHQYHKTTSRNTGLPPLGLQVDRNIPGKGKVLP